MLNKPIPKNTNIGFVGLVILLVSAAVMLPMAKGIDKKPEFLIKGSVTDVATGEPIVGAKVGDTEQYDSGKYGAVTDSNGNYRYKTWYEEHNVKCESPGYKTETKVLLTKILSSEPEKVLDFALRSNKNGGDAFKAAMPNGCKSNFERTEDLSAPFANGSTLVANTKIGNITVTGSTEAQCKVIATIRVEKGTTEQAEQLANMVKVTLEKENDNLVVATDLPEGHKEKGISVDLAITVEKNAGLQLKTEVGNVSISNIAGAIKCETNVGCVDCNGAIGNVDIKAEVGNVALSYAVDAPAACNAQIKTNVGNVAFKGPARMSAAITAEAKLGSIQTDFPLKVKVEMMRQKAEGAIGDSAGKVIVKSQVGSITLNSGE